MKKLLFGILLAVLLSSCAYYNTFYNAENLFKSAQSKELNNKGKPSSQAIEEYNKVIKKCGVVLTDYKDSKWADDALFLMGKALYFRGNNELQAKEKFEELQKFYPKCEFIPESYLFLARIAYDLNNKESAFEQLQTFIQNADFKKDHPKALILITDYYIKEKNYIDAQFYLTLLIQRYSDSKEYPAGYFLLGKSYFDNKDYDNSLKTFSELLSSRIDKKIKLDARYYITYNHLMKKELTLASKDIKKLLKLEYRDDKINDVRILQGRILCESGDIQDGIDILNNVSVNNPRVAVSAEANFFIGEAYFTKLKDYEKAIQYYNKVKTEYSLSPYIERAITRSAVASQIIQMRNQNRNLPLEDLLSEQYKLAEYYLYELELPDSALAIYAKIPEQKNFMVSAKEITLKRISTLDSLKTLYDAGNDIDSLVIRYNTQFGDSLIFKSTEVRSDTTKANTVKSRKDALNTRLVQIDKDLEQYDSKFIPYSFLLQMVINQSIKKDTLKAEELHQYIIQNYKDSRYHEASDEFMNGEEVSFMTKEEKKYFLDYERAVHSDSDSIAINKPLLENIANAKIGEISDKANFTLGYTYYITENDSIKAKPYLNQVLKNAPDSEYATFIKQFYDGKKFSVIDVLPAIIDLERMKAREDSLKKQIQIDSLASDSTKTRDKPEQAKDMRFDKAELFIPNSQQFSLEPEITAILNRRYPFFL